MSEGMAQRCVAAASSMSAAPKTGSDLSGTPQ